jgi:hypothetical protein
MFMYHAAEECPGCGVFFEASPELINVDFSGRQFTESRQEATE